MTRPGELYGRPWSESEYIIALDAYFSSKGQPRHERSPFIQEIATLLGRTPASIYMRMENFASIDPEESEHRRGLVKIGPLCSQVFHDWYNRRDHLRSTAEVLRRSAQRPPRSQLELFEPDPVALPKAFGKYELLDPIGEGGFGSVYSCIHTSTGAVGALKIIRLDKTRDRESVHRFFREIRAMKALDHPHVIRLHEDNLESEKDFPAFVMELAETNLTSHLNAHWSTDRVGPLIPHEERPQESSGQSSPP